MTAVVIPAVPMMQMVVPGVFVQPVFWPADAMHLVLHQVSYYLSDNNLSQDAFLRDRMDAEGWVPVELLASFNRMKSITTDLRVIYEVRRARRPSALLVLLARAAPDPASMSQPSPLMWSGAEVLSGAGVAGRLRAQAWWLAGLGSFRADSGRAGADRGGYRRCRVPRRAQQRRARCCLGRSRANHHLSRCSSCC